PRRARRRTASSGPVDHPRRPGEPSNGALRQERVRVAAARILAPAPADRARGRESRGEPVNPSGRPRVVILTPYFRPIVGGVESNAERLARYFAAAGLGVTVLTKRLTPDLADHDSLDGVPVERIGPLGPRSPMGKWLMLPAVTRWLLRRRADYDVVCSIDCRGVALGALAARALSHRPVVVQPQTTGVLAPDGSYRLGTRMVKHALGSMYVRADAVACI